MSAVDDYRKSVEFADRFDPMEALDKADAAIAELEAALAERDRRRCEDCDAREGRSHYCLLWSINTPDEHCCKDWPARVEEGGET